MKGFTLIEVILAIFVLTIAVSGAFALISQTLVIASSAQYKLTAAYLAQEGIEIVKNIRDSNWLKKYQGENISWDRDMSDTVPIGEPPRDFLVDYNDSTLSWIMFSSDNQPLKLDPNGFYNYSFGQATPFKRRIAIAKASDSGTEFIDVLVEISWQERGREHLFQVSDKLYEQGYE